MTDPLLVTRKLALMREHLARLRRRRPDTVDQLRADEDRLDALSMSVLVVVQEAIDLAFHIASDEGWGVPSTYRAGFELLASRGLVTADLASRLVAAARLRNRIAHGYASVDVELLWRELPDGITAFEELAVAVAAFAAQAP